MVSVVLLFKFSQCVLQRVREWTYAFPRKKKGKKKKQYTLLVLWLVEIRQNKLKRI